MKVFLSLLLAIVLAVGLAVILATKPGYVLITYGTTEIQFTLFAFICIFVVSTVIVAVLWVFIRRIYHFPRWLAAIRTRGSERAGERVLVRGLQAYSKGRYGPAGRLMERAAKGALRVPALLGAAYAAEAADEVSERDKYLRLLAQTSTRLSGLVLLVRVTFEIKRGEWERASATLRAIKESGMSGPEVQRQALLVACRLHDFEAIVSQLTALARSGVLPESEIRSYAIRAVSDKLSRPPTDAKQLWDSMPRNWKNWEEMRQIVAKEFARQGRSLDALGLLRQNLRARYSGEDVEALARLADIAPEERAKELAQLRNRHGSRPELLRESGRIAIELGLWGQAKSFLESAGTPAEDPELARLLGRIAENESRIKAALADYRLGLDSAIGKPADITDTRD